MRKGRLNENEVLAAAASVADREGYEALTMTAVARELGVQPASLYEHVRGRAGLVDGVQRLALGELGSRIGDAVAGCSRRAALLGLADAHRQLAGDRPGAWSALQRPVPAHVVLSPEAARVGSLTLAVVRGYPVPEESHVHAVRLIGAAINGFLTLTRADAFGHRADDEKTSWTAAIDALDRALMTWPAVGGHP